MRYKVRILSLQQWEKANERMYQATRGNKYRKMDCEQKQLFQFANNRRKSKGKTVISILGLF